MTLETMAEISALSRAAHDSRAEYDRACETEKRVLDELQSGAGEPSIVLCSGRGTSEWAVNAKTAREMVEGAIFALSCKAVNDERALIEKMREALR